MQTMIEIRGGGAPENKLLTGEKTRFIRKLSVSKLCRQIHRCIKYKHKRAFTMAEVLITIGIIGVVAAMTIPGLIADKRRTELYNQLQVAYSLISQALTRMSADIEYPVLPSNYQLRTFKKEYIKYFESPIDCEWGGVHATSNSQLCAGGSEVTGEDGIISQLSDSYSTYNKSSSSIDAKKIDDGQFALKNGMLIMIENLYKIYITVDVNGVGKSPNTWGHDLFTFQLMDDGRLLPMGAEGTDYNYEDYCSKTSNDKLNGIGCTYKALTDKTYWSKI